MSILDSNSVGSPSSDGEFKPLNSEEFRKQAHQMVDFIADYYHNIENYPVLSQVEPGYLRSRLSETPPYLPDSFDDIVRDVEKDIIPGMTHWLSPNFFAFFPATVSSAAFVGEMLCTAFNSVGFNWLACPAATELEMVVMDWLANMLKLPKSFMFSGTGGGVIQGTSSEAILCTLIAARDRALEIIGVQNIAKLVVYASDQAHSTYKKACKLAGVLPCNVRLLPTTQASNFSLSPALLRTVIEADVGAGLVPIHLCATLGTTSTTAVDPIGPLANVANDYGVWVHVDAAYAGSACICPEFRHHLDGIERVNSLSLSPHKWLLSYLDCCCLWVKQPSQIIRSLSTNPEYLNNKASESGSVVEFKDWQIGTGRKFKALRLWLVIRSYGVANLQSDPRFEIVTPRLFSLVCFRLNPCPRSATGTEEGLNRMLLDRVNSTGRVYMTHTIVDGVYMLRCAVGSTLTEELHVVAAWKLIKEGADALTERVESRV
ncbi:hypothetical protein PVL29_015601 [Vitis rotundifolia]|uniref:Uncharacterized protein n=1 Tax=Vitis rotundifolia TaxID=103349 RepID=A0AA38ZDD5_VITRO|nr:hypothetical protein PVL29_015601 [Vitis rotundifolia]